MDLREIVISLADREFHDMDYIYKNYNRNYLINFRINVLYFFSIVYLKHFLEKILPTFDMFVKEDPKKNNTKNQKLLLLILVINKKNMKFFGRV